MVREYSLRRDGDLQLSPHFRLAEFASKDGSDKVLVDDDLVFLLEQIREAAGGAVTINSGYRSPAHNAAVGGVSSSQHLYGRAADIVVSGASPLLVGQIAEYYLARRGELGSTGPLPTWIPGRFGADGTSAAAIKWSLAAGADGRRKI